MPQALDVQFMSGGAVYAQLEAAASDLTLNEAFARTGQERPLPLYPGTEFKGWSVDASAYVPERGYTTTLAAEYAAVAADGGHEDAPSLELHAIFGGILNPSVTFYAKDNQTLLAQEQIGSWESIEEAGIAPELTGEDTASLRKRGRYFAGWVDEAGQLRYYDEPLVEDVVLHPSYKKLAVDVSGAKGASADVSKAYLLRTDMADAMFAGFKLAAAEKHGGSLQKASEEGGYKVEAYYRATFGFENGGGEKPVKKGFGTVKVSVPVSAADATKARVAWVGANGKVETAACEVEDGAVAFGLDSIGEDAKANVAVSVMVEKKAPSAPAASGKAGGKSGKSGGSKTGASTSRAGSSGTSRSSSAGRSAGTGALTSSDAVASASSSAPAVVVEDDTGEDGDDVDADEDADAESGAGATASADGEQDAAPAAAEGAGGGEPGDGTWQQETPAGDDGQQVSSRPSGSGNAGLLYTVGMLVIAALAAGSWFVASRRSKVAASVEGFETAGFPAAGAPAQGDPAAGAPAQGDPAAGGMASQGRAGTEGDTYPGSGASSHGEHARSSGVQDGMVLAPSSGAGWHVVDAPVCDAPGAVQDAPVLSGDRNVEPAPVL